MSVQNDHGWPCLCFAWETVKCTLLTFLDLIKQEWQKGNREQEMESDSDFVRLMLKHQRQQLGNVPFRVLQAVKVGQKGSCFVHGAR